MSDQEWERWKTAFQKGGRPVQAVIKRARSDRRRQLVGLGIVYVTMAGDVAWQIPALRHAHTLAEFGEPIAGMSICVALVVAVHVTMRGTFGQHGAAPLEALAALERRHRARLRLMRMLPWFAAFIFVVGLAMAAMTDGFTPHMIELLAAWVLFMAGIFAFWFPRLRKRLERDLREAAEARRLLGETGDEGPEGAEVKG